jgi:predicted DNA-binding transcriptional regulator AlpA
MADIPKRAQTPFWAERAMRNLPYRMLRELEVKLLTGLSRTTRWRMIRDGLFPPPVKIGKRCTGTPLSAVLRWQRLLAGNVTVDESG